ncbi:hypothetical protein H6F43_09965, partial [Leptolyngbya sp. FACHB-36]
FLYELLNERPAGDQENNFGLLRVDGSPKPAFTALKNLIALLQDAGTPIQPGTLSYSLSGDLAHVHHTLLQKSNGRFYLVLWQEISCFDVQQRTDVATIDRPLTLTLNTAVAQATGYYPISSTAPAWQSSNPRQLPISVPDHPLVIELSAGT